MDNGSTWYQKLARSGWLGTGPQAMQSVDDVRARGAEGTMDKDKYRIGSSYEDALKKMKSQNENAGS